VANALESVTREQVEDMIERGDVVLVDALPTISYAATHLPGAVSMPPETVDERADRRIPNRRTDVVVYCANPTCDSSHVVARRLIELGYLSVRHYAGGKDEWTAAGLPLEGGRASAPATGETTTP
jgi:rhodanese-related sulfurtransferase